MLHHHRRMMGSKAPVCVCGSPFRCDAKERPGCELLWGVPILQTGNGQESDRAPFHDRTPPGERASTHRVLINQGMEEKCNTFYRPEGSGCRWLWMYRVYFQSESYQEDIYPMTAGNRPALTAEEWLSGINKGQKECVCDGISIGANPVAVFRK